MQKVDGHARTEVNFHFSQEQRANKTFNQQTRANKAEFQTFGIRNNDLSTNYPPGTQILEEST